MWKEISDFLTEHSVRAIVLVAANGLSKHFPNMIVTCGLQCHVRFGTLCSPLWGIDANRYRESGF